MQKYELTVVMPEKSTTANKKAVNKLIEKIVNTYEGKVEETKDWGKKDLFYEIKGENAGVFLHYLLQLDTDKINPLRENLKMQDDFIRYLLIKSQEQTANKEKNK